MVELGINMWLLSKAIEFNPYLMRLTDGERSLDWISGITKGWICLWSASVFWAWALALDPPIMFLASTASLGLTFSILAILVGLARFISIGTEIAVSEAQNERLTLLRLTRISHGTILWSLVLSNIYRARYWLTWIIGVLPFVTWFICQWYVSQMPSCPDWPPGECTMSLLGGHYLYFDAPMSSQKLISIFWCMCITISILGILLLANACSICIAMKTKNLALSAASVLGVAVPLVIVIVLVASEVFLVIDSAYGKVIFDTLFVRVLAIGTTVAISPFALLLGIQRFLLRYAFDDA